MFPLTWNGTHRARIVIPFSLVSGDAFSLSRAHFPQAEIGSHSHDENIGTI
jgi:hypothetical protein